MPGLGELTGEETKTQGGGRPEDPTTDMAALAKEPLQK